MAVAVLAGGLAAVASPAPGMAATPRAKYVAYAVEIDGSNVVMIKGSLQCSTPDTATVEIEVDLDVWVKPYPTAKGKGTFACDRTTKRNTIRVEFAPGTTVDARYYRNASISAKVYNSAGTYLSDGDGTATVPPIAGWVKITVDTPRDPNYAEYTFDMPANDTCPPKGMPAISGNSVHVLTADGETAGMRDYGLCDYLARLTPPPAAADPEAATASR